MWEWKGRPLLKCPGSGCKQDCSLVAFLVAIFSSPALHGLSLVSPQMRFQQWEVLLLLMAVHLPAIPLCSCLQCICCCFETMLLLTILLTKQCNHFHLLYLFFLFCAFFMPYVFFVLPSTGSLVFVAELLVITQRCSELVPAFAQG